MRYFITLVLFALVLSAASGQTSLFDKALVLDSLYNRILDGETELAPDVFAEFRTLYPGGDRLTNEALYEDINEENVFLVSKMNYVNSLVEDRRVEDDGRREALEGARATVLAGVDALALEYCPDEECEWYGDLTIMILVNEAQEMRRIRKKYLTDKPELAEFAEKLKALERALLAIDVQLDRIEREDEALIRGTGEDGGLGLPVAEGATVEKGFAPIVVEAAGGSVQGAVIDGASRWIAERMREELSIAFFDRFEIWLEERQLHTLFPHTASAFKITASTDFALMLQVLRTAFEDDLRELPFNVGPFLRYELVEYGDKDFNQYEANDAYVAYRKAVLDYYDGPDNYALYSSDPTIKAASEVLDAKLDQLANTNKGLNYVLFAIDAMRELSEGTHPANLLSLLNARSDELFPQGGDIRPALMLADVIVRSFIRVDAERGTTWVSRKELTQLSRNQQLREFYYGLVYHEVHRKYRRRRNELLAVRKKFAGKTPYLTDLDIKYETSATERQLMRDQLENTGLVVAEQRLRLLEKDEFWMDLTFQYTPEEIGTLLNELSMFTERMDNLTEQYTALRQTGRAGIGNPELVQLIRHSLNVVKPVLNAALNDDQQLSHIENLSLGILDAYTGVLERDYEAVILSVIPVVSSLIDVDFAEQIAAAEGREAVIKSLKQDQGLHKRQLHEIFRYGAFLAAVAESRSPEDIKQAIRAIALPTGSYSIKRRSFGNISLNAYPGLTGGYEVIQNDLGRRWAPNTGFTAPLGLAFSWGYRGNINNSRYLSDLKYRRRVDHALKTTDDKFLTGHSGSVFFSLLDLGAVVLFRLSDEESSLPEDVGFQQVFSPGVIYSHGFPNLPLSVMAGMQVSPQLRKFGDEPADAFRFNLGVTVDLPMANFHTRSVPRE